jgi:hypothetical protein
LPFLVQWAIIDKLDKSRLYWIVLDWYTSEFSMYPQFQISS